MIPKALELPDLQKKVPRLHRPPEGIQSVGQQFVIKIVHHPSDQAQHILIPPLECVDIPHLAGGVLWHPVMKRRREEVIPRLQPLQIPHTIVRQDIGLRFGILLRFMELFPRSLQVAQESLSFFHIRRDIQHASAGINGAFILFLFLLHL